LDADMPRKSSGPDVSSVAAAILLGLVAGASCGGSSSTTGIDGGSPKGSSSGGSQGGSSGSTSGATFGGASGSGSVGGSQGGPYSSSSSGGSESGPPFVPPTPPSPTAGLGPGCTPMNGGGSIGPTECLTTLGEACGDAGYQATCACPQGTCACFGSATNVVSFTGCPSCPIAEEVFMLCGFPHQ
jgi:hypothetical protein